MANMKRRSRQQIMEEKSVEILKKTLPEEWVFHDYKPDYGIDYVIEVFKYLKENINIAETLGEQFLVQLKAVDKLEKKTENIVARTNVENSKPIFFENNFKKIEIVKFRIDVSLLMTIQTIGAALPVLLIVVDLSDEGIYYICLNDYIDKIIIPTYQDYRTQDTITIKIPITNKITSDRKSIKPLEFYAKRTKLFGAFQKINYQAGYVEYNQSLETIKHYIEKLMFYDFWENTKIWFAIESIYREMNMIYEIITEENKEVQLTKISELKMLSKFSENELMEGFNDIYIKNLWYQLNNLGCMYEESCREWFLPIHY